MSALEMLEKQGVRFSPPELIGSRGIIIDILPNGNRFGMVTPEFIEDLARELNALAKMVKRGDFDVFDPAGAQRTKQAEAAS